MYCINAVNEKREREKQESSRLAGAPLPRERLLAAHLDERAGWQVPL